MSYETENIVTSIQCIGNDGEIHFYYLGKLGITKITENKPSGDGDRWHYDIYRGDKLDSRIFNVDFVCFKDKQ